jgi:ferredoxin-NADP reductase
MPRITFEQRAIESNADETVLDALLRAGVDAPHSCKSGVCQSCLMYAVDGTPPPGSQRGLTPEQAARGCFLACQCRPATDLRIARADASLHTAETRIEAVAPVSADVTQVLIGMPRDFPIRPGQFVHLSRPDGLSRPYSVANDTLTDGVLELHVRRIPNGRMSGWLCYEAHRGDAVTIAGPHGDCTYDPAHAGRPLLLAGTGTGLAPLLGIVRDALAHGHRGPIHLHHGAVSPAGLYFVEQLRDLERRHANFHYEPCVLEAEDAPPTGVQTRPLDQSVAEAFPRPAGWTIYLCGDPELVTRMRKGLYLAGADLAEIHADPFVTAA